MSAGTSRGRVVSRWKHTGHHWEQWEGWDQASLLSFVKEHSPGGLQRFWGSLWLAQHVATDGHPQEPSWGDPEPPQAGELLLPSPRDPAVLSSLVQVRKMGPTGKQLRSLRAGYGSPASKIYCCSCLEIILQVSLLLTFIDCHYQLSSSGPEQGITQNDYMAQYY